MTYIELINLFWKIHEDVNFSPHDIALYFYLLREANRQGWPEPFVCPNRVLTLGLNISDMTLIRCRDRLAAHGVFSYKSEKNKRKAPTYYLTKLSRDVSRTVSRDVSRTVSSGVSRDVSINKDIKTIRPKNKSPISPDKPGECVLDLEFEEPKKKKTKSRTPQESPPAPTLEEVKAYFLSQSADTRLDDWEAEAEIFFNNFDATDWVDASGRKIKRWDSRANRWILEKEQRKKTHNVTTSTNRPDTTADERQQRQFDIASYVAHNIGSNADHPGGSGTDMPI